MHFRHHIACFSCISPTDKHTHGGVSSLSESVNLNDSLINSDPLLPPTGGFNRTSEASFHFKYQYSILQTKIDFVDTAYCVLFL